MKKFYVTVAWPPEMHEPPWLVLIEAGSKPAARRRIQKSVAVREGRGRVVRVEFA